MSILGGYQMNEHSLNAGLPPDSLDRWGREFKRRPVFGGRPHAERRMGRLTVVVLEPLAELREDGFRVAELGAVDVVTLERVHERLGEAVALRAVRGRRNRHQAQLVRVEDTGR